MKFLKPGNRLLKGIGNKNGFRNLYRREGHMDALSLL